MKRKILLVAFMLANLFLLTSITKATQWEIGFTLLGQLSKTMSVYKYNSTARAYEFIGAVGCSGPYSTKPFDNINQDINIAFDIDNDTDHSMTLLPNTTYFLVINNWWMSISGSSQDIWFSYTEEGGFVFGGQNIDAVYNKDMGGNNWDSKTINLVNDFGRDRGDCAGNINLNNVPFQTVGTAARVFAVKNSSFPHTVSGINNQPVNEYIRKWRKFDGATNDSITSTLTSINNYSRTAKYAKQIDATLTNNFGGGTITVNSTPYNSSSTAYIYDDSTYTISATNQTVFGIDYVFDHWGGSTSGTQNPLNYNNPSSGLTLTAYYTGTVNMGLMNVRYTSSNGQKIKLEWNEPQKDSVIYQVWRSVTGGSTGIIAYLNHGTSSFTDYDYTQNLNGDDKLFYKVKACYQPSNTWNDPGYILNRGDFDNSRMASNNGSEKQAIVGEEVPNEYSISNYPNPFNPTTVIKYNLPKDGYVTLKVYDILGKEIVTLVNENKQAGYYNATFNASNLPSGIYIYSIQSNGFNQSKKMLLMK